MAFHEGKLLCVRQKHYKDSVMDIAENWCLPGGGLDEGETLVDGIKREMVEETGVMPVVGDLLYIQQFAYDGTEYLEFFFHVTNGEDYLLVDLTKSSHGTAEIAEIDFVVPAITNILPEFLMTEDLLQKIASPSPATIISRL
jgi:ADP-ribose pyrophosphatase YjhB (NUDIX family)